MPVIEDITEEEEVSRTEDRPPEGNKNENKFPIEDEAEVESDSEDFFDASDLTTLQQWQFISVRPQQIRFRKSQFNACVVNWSDRDCGDVAGDTRCGSISRVEIRSKMKFWSILFLFEMDQNCRFGLSQTGPKMQIRTEIDYVSSFGPLSNSSNLQIRFISKRNMDHIIWWTKLSFSNPIQHVRLNSFKHFS